jgi:hypothetical protein
MGLALRDTQHHTYGDYLEWPEELKESLAVGILPDIVIDWERALQNIA